MSLLKERLRQKYRTLNWPAVEPELSPHYRGRPVLNTERCDGCGACFSACPTNALMTSEQGRLSALDMGKCIFCGCCASACSRNVISFSHDYRLASSRREDLLIKSGDSGAKEKAEKSVAKDLSGRGIFRRSFKLRQVSAGGCNACEADCNVLGTLVYDIGRFGIEFTASPRHADAIVLTGPISANMFPALLNAWESVPEPRIMVAVGTCAISGGLFADSQACAGGMDKCASFSVNVPVPADFKVDMFIPGCPPNPWTILDGLLQARQCR